MANFLGISEPKQANDITGVEFLNWLDTLIIWSLDAKPNVIGLRHYYEVY